jgi:hypothetical protein
MNSRLTFKHSVKQARLKPSPSLLTTYLIKKASDTMITMNTDREVYFQAFASELEPEDNIAYGNETYIVNDIEDVPNGYILHVTETQWSEDTEIFISDSEILDVIAPEVEY